AVNRTFHDHECAYYDERFAIEHDARSARQARAEVERLLGRPLRAGEVLLDPGCGTGWQAAGLRRAAPGVTVVGVDLSAGMLGKARAAGAGPLVQADATRLPLAAGSVDLVVTRGVLHHLPDVVAALADWRRVLRPGGAVVVASEPTPTVERHGEVLVRALLPLLRRPLTPTEDFWELASMAANLHVFTPEGLAAQAREAGYTDVRLDTADLLSTLVLTGSYVVHGRRRALARRIPWRALEAGARAVDGAVLDRLVPARLRHTVVGVLRP
ncbi:MAG TPA: class I SAM-dependent methyltransferase, partial [Mycobacteriales bacterium]|nr:class I SAM-dependent methyltransferase [Mycobacteriales bacterium]